MTDQWQRVVDLIARLADVPACLIMKTELPDHFVLVASDTENNPYHVGQNFELNSNLYCHSVIEKRSALIVRDARADPEWDANEDLEFGMTFYVGLPICWPDDSVFGTICMLDARENEQALQHQALLGEFRDVIENDLVLLAEIDRRKGAEQALQSTLATLEQQVANRTQKLADTNKELEEANTALRVLVAKFETARQEVEAQVRQQIAGLVLPHLSKLHDIVDDCQAGHLQLELAEAGLAKITSSFASSLARAYEQLTPTEVEIAQMVISGRTTKEIARLLSRQTSTIDYHRNNIRKKLGIDGRNVNLCSHLRSLTT